jgi:Flp pilus assembly protein TadD
MMLSVILAALLAPGPQEPPPPPSEPLGTVEGPAPTAVSAGGSDAAIQAGLNAFRRRQFGKAEIEFRKAVDADPGNAAAHFYLGYTYYKIVEPRRPFDPGKQRAAQEFAKAYELDPGFKPIWSWKKGK